MTSRENLPPQGGLYRMRTSYRANTNDRSTRAFAVKPAPSARRYAALGMTGWRGRATVYRRLQAVDQTSSR
jgi:hypothetical protein